MLVVLLLLVVRQTILVKSLDCILWFDELEVSGLEDYLTAEYLDFYRLNIFQDAVLNIGRGARARIPPRHQRGYEQCALAPVQPHGRHGLVSRWLTHGSRYSICR